MHIRAGEWFSKLFRGQASTEFIIILAASLVIFSAIAVVSSSQLVDLGTQHTNQQANSAVVDLARAADDVYQQGLGARKKVYIEIPDDIVANESFVRNNTINMRIGNTDVWATTVPTVFGAIPSTSGGNYCWVRSYGSYVTVCTAFIDVYPTSVYELMAQNQTVQATLDVTNDANITTDVNITVSWGNAHVGLVTSPLSFSLAPDANQTVTLTFTTDSTAGGIYSGDITIAGNNTYVNDTIDVPVTVEVTFPSSPVQNCTAVSINISTYKDSGYTTPSSAFNRTQRAAISTGNWSGGEALTMNIIKPGGGSVTGYPTTVTANASGGYAAFWDAVGATVGVYNVTVNNSGTIVSKTYNVTACP